MSKRTVLVKVALINGKENDDPAYLRGTVPELGIMLGHHPTAFLDEAPRRFQSLARVWNRGRNVDPGNPHVDQARDMFLPVSVVFKED